jgi:hypothetical protein
VSDEDRSDAKPSLQRADFLAQRHVMAARNRRERMPSLLGRVDEFAMDEIFGIPLLNRA